MVAKVRFRFINTHRRAILFIFEMDFHQSARFYIIYLRLFNYLHLEGLIIIRGSEPLTLELYFRGFKYFDLY